MAKEVQATELPSTDELLNEWLGLSAAAKAAGVAARTMAYMVSSGRMRSVQTPVGRLIEPKQLAAYARKRRRRGVTGIHATRREQEYAKLTSEIEEELVRNST